MSTNPRVESWNQVCEDLILGLPLHNNTDQWLHVQHFNSPECTKTTYDTQTGCQLVKNWTWNSPSQAFPDSPIVTTTAWRQRPHQISKGLDVDSGFLGGAGSPGSQGRLHFLSHKANKAAVVWAIVPRSPDMLGAGQGVHNLPYEYKVTEINQLYFMGAPNWMGLSPNSQQLVVNVNRSLAELQSLDRVATMCEIAWGEQHYLWLTAEYNRSKIQLSQDAITKIRLQFTKDCNPSDVSRTPTRPGLFSFIQLATACSVTASCPSAALPIWGQNSPGSRSVMTISRQPCPLGSFCPVGVQQDCPAGFTCPTLGMENPLRCSPRDGYTCYTNHTGLIEPKPCPVGQICSVPYLPPIPVGPGLYDGRNASTRGESVRILACPNGSYCNLGCSADNLDSDCRCPEGTTCPQTSVVVPWPCLGEYNGGGVWKCDKTGRTTNPPLCEQGMGPYCPAGSQDEHPLCPAGKFCKKPLLEVTCASAYYCPAGTLIQEECPGGYYCPTPSEKYKCPHRNFCIKPSTKPAPCNFLQICPEGSSNPFDMLPWVLGVLFGAAIFAVRRWYKKYRAEARSHFDETLNSRGEKKSDRQRRQDELSELLISQEDDYVKFDAGPDESVPMDQFPGLGGTRSAVPRSRGLDQNLIPQARVDTNLIPQEDQTLIAQPLSRRFSNEPQMAQKLFARDNPSTYVSMTSQRDQRLSGEPDTFGIDIDFRGLTLEVGKEGKKVLQNVDGDLRAGRTCAIMGPSGAGKTSLLSALAGKATYGKVSGDIKVNGQSEQLTRFNKLMGFVPQEDIMHRRLTVHENISMSANLRLPSELKPHSRFRIINSVIETLGLTMIRHIKIGDESERGISGGQRKRVNIAMEMVSLPRVLFLDEPTSGLDSTSSREVCSCMQQIAESKNVLVAAVIHQPRYEIFAAIDDVIFLCPGGRTVYCGPTNAASDYFEMQGYAIPAHVNPADFFMDIIAGDVEPSATPSELCAMWEEAVEGEFGETRLLGQPMNTEEINAHRTTAGIGHQIVLYLRQSVVQQKRELLFVGLDMILLLIGGLFLGAAFNDHSFYSYKAPLPELVWEACPGKLQDKCKAPTQDLLPIICSMVGLVMGLTGAVASLRVFGDVKLHYFRDRARGSSALAFFIGRSLAHLPSILLWPYVFLLPFYPLANPAGTFGEWYGILLALQLAASSLGYLVSVIVPEKLSYLAAVIVVLAQMMFSGSNPTLPMLKSSMPWGAWINNFVFLRWGQEALYIIQVEPSMNADPAARPRIVDSMSSIRGYDPDNIGLDIGLCLLISICLRAGACLALTYYQRDKQLQV
eukprot:TRINITY_DN18314_c0_g1_i1.p1 TRINITY_DN18314_c0_g1~~TRINITY_DN18314_c0_g1_i1.p1  ORF type:complete len:1304 (+),score=237.06 TRINITY_DN18314_c0_g1_i1:313-4224(+)